MGRTQLVINAECKAGGPVPNTAGEKEDEWEGEKEGEGEEVGKDGEDREKEDKEKKGQNREKQAQEGIVETGDAAHNELMAQQ